MEPPTHRSPSTNVRPSKLWLVLCCVLVTAAPALAVTVNVQVNGVKDDIKNNVLASLSIKQYKDYGKHPAATIRRLHSEAPEEIRKALQPFGYFSPDIADHLTHQGDTWTATYDITPGKAVILRNITVKVTGPGAAATAFRAIQANPPMSSGEPFRQQHYTQTKHALQLIAAEYGWLDARLSTHELKVNPAEHQADATLVLVSGPRYHFGPVKIEQDILKPGFVQRYINIHPGEPYNTGELSNLQSALSASGYFSSVIVNPKKKEAEHFRVPVTVTATPAKRDHYSVGLGYGTDTGPRLSLGWDRRWVNRSGHRFRLNARISQIETQAVARYIVPLADPTTDRLTYSATLNRQDYGNTTSDLFGVGANRITMWHGWQQNILLNANRYISYIGEESFTSRLLMPGIRFSRIEAHPADRPRKGYSVDAELRGAAKLLASDANFLRADISANFIFPLGPGRLLLRGEVGAIATSNPAEIPVALRFYAGGSASVRGYAYQSIGPRDAQGRVVGGRYLRVASVEYDFPVADNWAIAGFLDAGTASNSFTSPPEKGIGIGVRYFTPVGAIRLDFGHPVDHPELSPIRIHLSIGLSL